MLTRSFIPSDLEVRSDGRTVHGIVAPFDQPADIWEPDLGSFTETIRRGAFTRTLAERGASRVKLLAMHDDRALPLGRATALREDARGLYGELRISKTAAGDEALELVRDGALDAFSIGFTVPRDGERWTPDRTRELVEIRLHEISLVNFPAYAGALVAGVRHGRPYDSEHDPDLIARRLKLAQLLRNQS
jgi:uncharacterized protein